MTELVLSCFPGIGLLDTAFEAEGFCVVRGPDVLWGGDIRAFHPPAGKFDGIVGGPPCQSFSSLVHLVRANGCEPKFGNLIPEFERCVREALPTWFVMENVPQAPEPEIIGYGVTSFLLDNSMLDAGDGWGHEQRRVRRFSFGLNADRKPPSLLRWIDLACFFLPDAERVNAVLGASSQSAGCLGKTKARKERERERQPCVTSTDGGERPSEKRRQRTVTASQASFTDNATAERYRVKAVSGSNGGNGSERSTPGAGNNGKGRYKLADACRLQGLPEDFLADAPFTADGKLKAVANGVPIPMGRAIAKAVKEALQCN